MQFFHPNINISSQQKVEGTNTHVYCGKEMKGRNTNGGFGCGG